MSETPWFKFFPSDYLADTMGLSCCEHGVYLLLLAVSWKRGPLPDDMDHLARLAANPPIETLRFILENYWTRTEQGWLNERLEHERAEMLRKHQRRVDAGRKGGQAKASNAIAMLEQCSSKALASSRSQKPEARSQKKEKIPVGAQAPAVNGSLKSQVWDLGERLLGSRSLVGKLVKEHGEAAVLKALIDCDLHEPVDPKGYIHGALRGGKKPAAGSSQQERLFRSGI